MLTSITLLLSLSDIYSKVSSGSTSGLAASTTHILDIRCPISYIISARTTNEVIPPLRWILGLYDILVHTLINLAWSRSIEILTSLVLHRSVNSLISGVVNWRGPFHLIDISLLDHHAHFTYELLDTLLGLF